jgi:hypothetical protein
MRHRTKRQIQATTGTHYRVEPHDSRAFALYDNDDGNLIGIFVYLKGAAYVARKLAQLESAVISGVKACVAGAAD